MKNILYKNIKKVISYTAASFFRLITRKTRTFNPWDPPKKILILKTDHLGDLLMTTPLIRELHLRYPATQLDIIVKEASLNAVKNNYRLNNIYRLNTPWTANPGQKKDSIFKIISTIMYLKDQDYDYVLCLQDSLRTHILGALIGFRSIIGFTTPQTRGFMTVPITEKEYSNLHIVEKNLLCLDYIDKNNQFEKIKTSLPLNKEDYCLEYFTDAHKKKKYQKLSLSLPDNFIAVHPGAGTEKKMLLPQKTAKLCKMLMNEGFNIVLFGKSSIDKNACNEITQILNQHLNSTIISKDIISKNIRAKKIKAQGKLVNLIKIDPDLDETAFILSKASLLISHDTGTMHLAAALKTKNIAIFGPSDEKIWGPWNPKARVYAGPRNCPKNFYKICGASNTCPGLDCLNQADTEKIKALVIELISEQ
jgi:heptosyltransferase-3